MQLPTRRLAAEKLFRIDSSVLRTAEFLETCSFSFIRSLLGWIPSSLQSQAEKGFLCQLGNELQVRAATGIAILEASPHLHEERVVLWKVIGEFTSSTQFLPAMLRLGVRISACPFVRRLRMELTLSVCVDFPEHCQWWSKHHGLGDSELVFNCLYLSSCATLITCNAIELFSIRHNQEHRRG